MKKYLIILFTFLFVLQTSYTCYAEVPDQKPSFFFGIKKNGTFVSYDDFGRDNINLDWIYRTGLGYSFNGGFIDTTHFGESLLWTRHYQQEIYKGFLDNDEHIILKSKKPALEFHVIIDSSRTLSDYEMKFTSIQLGQYLAYNWAVIHEAMSWYGYKSTGKFSPISEFGSAFSPEDLYSDLLGTLIASDALISSERSDSNENFDSACLRIMNEALNGLELQDANFVDKALENVKGNWYNGESYPDNEVWKRSFDIGLDGCIAPCLIKDFNGCPVCLPVPKIPTLDGFSIKVEIKFKEKLQKQGNILLKIVGKKKKERLAMDDLGPIV